jgi:hypothetical protein
VAGILTYFERHGDVLFTLAFLWFFGWIAASAFHRRAKGKPIHTVPPDNALFVEKWTSGRSLRSLVTKLGGARNCLLVAVTSDVLLIRPHFPFTLGFLPETYGLDWEIPRKDIKRVSKSRGLMRETVLVEFGLPQAQTGRVELMLRDADKFIQALGR